MTRDFTDVLTDAESLRKFHAALNDFRQFFCDNMVDGVEFTLRLEVHGSDHEMAHCFSDNRRFYRSDVGEKGKGRGRGRRREPAAA